MAILSKQCDSCIIELILFNCYWYCLPFRLLLLILLFYWKHIFQNSKLLSVVIDNMPHMFSINITLKITSSDVSVDKPFDS